MVDVVEAITTSLDMAKRLRDLNKKVGEADFKMLLADLTSALGDAKLEAANMKIELASAKLQLQQMKDDADRQSAASPTVINGTYVFGNDERRFCTGCYDVSGRKISLTEMPTDFQVFGKYQCPSCDKTFGKKDAVDTLVIPSLKGDF